MDCQIREQSADPGEINCGGSIGLPKIFSEKSTIYWHGLSNKVANQPSLKEYITKDTMDGLSAYPKYTTKIGGLIFNGLVCI